MSPNSNERADWIQARLAVLDACRKDLTRRVAYYHQALGVDNQTVHAAMQALRAEELVLTVELSVYNTHVAANIEEKFGIKLPPGRGDQ